MRRRFGKRSLFYLIRASERTRSSASTGEPLKIPRTGGGAGRREGGEKKRVFVKFRVKTPGTFAILSHCVSSDTCVR